MGYLATSLRNNQIDTKIFDERVEKDVLGEIKTYNPNVLGFNVDMSNIVKSVDFLKNFNDKLIVFGGSSSIFLRRRPDWIRN